MKRLITFFTVIVFACLFAATGSAFPYLVVEPDLNTLVNWDLMPSGLLIVGYDTDHNGKADFFTLRVVVRAYFSSEIVSEVVDYFPNNLIFVVNYGGGQYFYYVTSRQPFFYAFDLNEDGVWDLMYKDAFEDGVNGNEKFYESPSGMFTANIQNF